MHGVPLSTTIPADVHFLGGAAHFRRGEARARIDTVVGLAGGEPEGDS